MANRPLESLAGPIPQVALVLVLATAGGLIVAQSSAGLSLAGALLLVVLLVSFLNTELALHIILLSMLLSPEIVVGGLAGISLGKPAVKGNMLVLRMEDLVLVTVALAWFARTAIFKELGLIRRTPLNPAIFAYVVSLVLATLLGILLGNVPPIRGLFFTLKYIEYFVVYFMIINFVQDKRQIRRLVVTAFVTCAISAVIGLAQIPSGERVAAPFEGKYGEPNTFGGYLVFMLALILAQALCAKTLPACLGWVGFAGLVTIPLLYTLSRSSWLAVVPMIFTLILLSPRRLPLIVGLGVLVVLGPPAFPKQVVDRYNYTLNAKEDRGEYHIGSSRLDSSTSERLRSWGQGFQAWQRKPLLGFGVTGYGFIDAQYVRVLVETGLLGFAAFFWLVWRIYWTARNVRRQLVGTRFEALSLGYLAGVVALITHAIGANTFIIVRIMEPFWFMTGVIAVLPTLFKTTTHGTGDYKIADHRIIDPYPAVHSQ